MSYVIAEPCVDVMDKACTDECPVDCIYEGGRKLYIRPDECIDCSACEPVCPVDAIYFEQDLPSEWVGYASANVDFFGGNRTPNNEAPFVAAVPPRTVSPPRREAPPPVWVSVARLGRRLLR